VSCNIGIADQSFQFLPGMLHWSALLGRDAPTANLMYVGDALCVRRRTKLALPAWTWFCVGLWCAWRRVTRRRWSVSPVCSRWVQQQHSGRLHIRQMWPAGWACLECMAAASV